MLFAEAILIKWVSFVLRGARFEKLWKTSRRIIVYDRTFQNKIAITNVLQSHDERYSTGQARIYRDIQNC